jgi:hypothetical protein
MPAGPTVEPALVAPALAAPQLVLPPSVPDNGAHPDLAPPPDAWDAWDSDVPVDDSAQSYGSRSSDRHDLTPLWPQSVPEAVQENHERETPQAAPRETLESEAPRPQWLPQRHPSGTIQ